MNAAKESVEVAKHIGDPKTSCSNVKIGAVRVSVGDNPEMNPEFGVMDKNSDLKKPSTD